MVRILMMSAKMASIGLLKIKEFRNKGYDVIISLYDVSTKIYHVTQIFIVDVVMWPKFGSSRTSMREKTLFMIGGLGWSLIIWVWH